MLRFFSTQIQKITQTKYRPTPQLENINNALKSIGKSSWDVASFKQTWNRFKEADLTPDNTSFEAAIGFYNDVQDFNQSAKLYQDFLEMKVQGNQESLRMVFRQAAFAFSMMRNDQMMLCMFDEIEKRGVGNDMFVLQKIISSALFLSRFFYLFSFLD